LSSVRDHVSDVPARTRIAANRVHVRASNAWYRVAGYRLQGARARLSNRRNQRMIKRGRRDLPRRAADSLRSSLPLYRGRIDPATGRPNRDRRALGRAHDTPAAGFRERRQTRAATARIGTERTERLRDHAASRGLDASREHYDAILADRARRAARRTRRTR